MLLWHLRNSLSNYGKSMFRLSDLLIILMLSTGMEITDSLSSFNHSRFYYKLDEPKCIGNKLRGVLLNS